MNDMKPAVQKWALYGLAGNPPHNGHWSCVQALADRGYHVLVVPSFSHAFGKEMAPYELRLDWLRQARKDFGLDYRCEIWDVEQALAKGRPQGARIYSIDVLLAARATFGHSPELAIGPDNAEPAVFNRFHEAARIREDFGVVVLPETAHVRSTSIRAKLSQEGVVDAELIAWVGASIADEVAKYFGEKLSHFKNLAPK